MFSGYYYGLLVDLQHDFYCSMREQHRVVKILLENRTIKVAGTGSQGSALDQFDQPWRIVVDQQFNLFVTKHANGRIQRFQPGQINGETIAGQGTPSGLMLHHPTDVTLDADGLLHIVDNGSHRIVRASQKEFKCTTSGTGN
jgi:glucose/arabinose dehydrogenase